MNFLQKLFARNRVTQPTITSDYEEESPYVRPWHTFGNHIYRTATEDPTVYYIDENRNIRKKIVNNMGFILNFPGIQKEDFWIKEVSPVSLLPQIHYRTSFEKKDGRIRMLWQIQPDGRYWEDSSGFGAEKDREVILYAWFNENGDFDGPFRIYSVGDCEYV